MQRATKTGDRTTVSWDCPAGDVCIIGCSAQQTRPRPAVPCGRRRGAPSSATRAHTSRDGTYVPHATLWCHGPARNVAVAVSSPLRAGKTIVSVTPTKPSPQARPRQALARRPRPPNLRPTKPLPSERKLPARREGTPLPDSTGELPPVIRRTEVRGLCARRACWSSS